MILVDSGPLIAAAITDDGDHRRYVDLFAALHLDVATRNSDDQTVPTQSPRRPHHQDQARAIIGGAG